MNKRTRYCFSLLCAVCALLGLAACGSTAEAPPLALEDVFPAEDAVTGWGTEGELRTYDSETLFDMVNGQADAFFAYGFERVAAQDYANAEGTVVRIEVWQLATPADAYGLFSAGIAGEPVDVGNAGDADPGRRVAFWQSRYFVQAFARQSIPDAELRALAQAVAARLPQGGARPALVERLPEAGLVPRSAQFFHEALSIQDRLWLGAENVLGLGPETDAVLATYEIDGAEAQLLLVQYANAERAVAALDALAASPVEGLVVAETSDGLFGAIFGSVDRRAASALLKSAMP